MVLVKCVQTSARSRLVVLPATTDLLESRQIMIFEKCGENGSVFRANHW